MKIKQTKSQLDGVALILAIMIDLNQPENVAERLVYGIVKKAFNKIRVKSEAIKTPHGGWGITLTDEEAMALYVFLQTAHIPAERYQYEAIQLGTISNLINQKFG